MLDFIKILFFSNLILLTPEPVDIGPHAVEIPLKKPISALTAGARIEIDVSSIISRNENDEISDLRKKVQELIPGGGIRAELVDKKGETIVLAYQGGTSISKESIHITLLGEEGILPDREFTRLTVYSQFELNDVSIFWRNHKK